MHGKLKHYQERVTAFAAAWSDPRRLGMIVFVVIALLITWSGVKVITTNYALQKDIAIMEQQNEVRRLQNQNLELENKFYETDEYLELEARRHFGKALPGETVWVVPREVALRYVSEPTRVAAEEAALAQVPSGARANFNAWLDFLLHRSSREEI
jgi:cell division protein FtsB